MRFAPASCARCGGGRSTAVNSRFAKPSTKERFGRLAKTEKSLGDVLLPKGMVDDLWLWKQAEKLGLPKLNFQVLRRTMATLAQGKGSVKDIQAHLRHSKADTTANEYMQELPDSVGRMVESMYEELMESKAAASADLLPNATNEDGRPTAMCKKRMVGTTGLEPATSTVSS